MIFHFRLLDYVVAIHEKERKVSPPRRFVDSLSATIKSPGSIKKSNSQGFSKYSPVIVTADARSPSRVFSFRGFVRSTSQSLLKETQATLQSMSSLGSDSNLRSVFMDEEQRHEMIGAVLHVAGKFQ